jgi:hypothetical protein
MGRISTILCLIIDALAYRASLIVACRECEAMTKRNLDACGRCASQNQGTSHLISREMLTLCALSSCNTFHIVGNETLHRGLARSSSFLQPTGVRPFGIGMSDERID